MVPFLEVFSITELAVSHYKPYFANLIISDSVIMLKILPLALNLKEKRKEGCAGDVSTGYRIRIYEKYSLYSYFLNEFRLFG